MKASEMTNEELASWLESITPDFEGYTSPVSDYFREAAARLRNVTVRSDNSAVIVELRRRLKVAEDALGESRVAVCHICDQKHMCGHGTEKFDPCCIYKDIDNTLAAIREKGN